MNQKPFVVGGWAGQHCHLLWRKFDLAILNLFHVIHRLVLYSKERMANLNPIFSNWCYFEEVFLWNFPRAYASLHLSCYIEDKDHLSWCCGFWVTYLIVSSVSVLGCITMDSFWYAKKNMRSSCILSTIGWVLMLLIATSSIVPSCCEWQGAYTVHRKSV